MSNTDEQLDEEALQELPRPEREAILRLLAWLATRDDSVDQKELEFLAGFEELLALNDDEDRAIFEEVDKLDRVDEVVDGIETDWVRALLVGKLITAAWVDGTYDARERVGIRRLCRAMGISDEELGAAEAEILEALEKAPDDELDPEEEDSGRFFKIAGAAVLGGGLMAATGGLAAPAIGGAIGSAMGLSGAAATSAGLAALGGGALGAGGLGMAGGTAVVSAALGAAGVGAAGRAMSKRSKEVDDVELIDLDGDGAAVVLGVSGFLSADSDFKDDWEVLTDWTPHADVQALRWEAKANRDLHETVASVAGKFGAKKGAEFFAKRATKRASKMLAWPAWALELIQSVGNPWSVARDLAEKTGAVLAEGIADAMWGPRPATLVGFSLGTRVVAEALDQMDDAVIASNIERVVLMGGAVGRDRLEWDDLADTVPGCVVNAYSTDDWVLGGLYRAAEWFEEPIGLTPLEAEGVTDVDVTETAGGHLEYRENMEGIFADIDDALDERRRASVQVGICRDGTPCQLCQNRSGYCHHHAGR